MAHTSFPMPRSSERFPAFRVRILINITLVIFVSVFATQLLKMVVEGMTYRVNAFSIIVERTGTLMLFTVLPQILFLDLLLFSILSPSTKQCSRDLRESTLIATSSNAPGKFSPAFPVLCSLQIFSACNWDQSMRLPDNISLQRKYYFYS